MRSQNSASVPTPSEAPRQAATLVAYGVLGVAVLLWLSGWYSTLNWGPSITLPRGHWFAMLGSLALGLASASVASWLAIRQGAGRASALGALAGALVLLLLFRLFVVTVH